MTCTGTTRAPSAVPTALGLVSQEGASGRAAAELDATASDGTAIPVSIVRNGSTALDGTHPVMMTVVGSYGFSTTPDYDRVPQTWLDLGGVYAIAHVRGGGEGGDAWHRAAIGAGKARSWTPPYRRGRGSPLRLSR